MTQLILPGDEEFDETLGLILPFNWQQVADRHNDIVFVARAGSGILEAVGQQEAREYHLGGEYDERLSEIGDSMDEVWG